MMDVSFILVHHPFQHCLDDLINNFNLAIGLGVVSFGKIMRKS